MNEDLRMVFESAQEFEEWIETHSYDMRGLVLVYRGLVWRRLTQSELEGAYIGFDAHNDSARQLRLSEQKAATRVRRNAKARAWRKHNSRSL